MAARSHTTTAVRCHIKQTRHFGTFCRSDIRCSLAGNNPCINGGTCTDGIGHPICACPAPLASDDAGDVCIDECNPNPCLNGGVCTDGIGRPICECPAGFCGQTCADPLDASQNGGQCCEDDPAWAADWSSDLCSVFDVPTMRQYCTDSRAVNAAGVTAADACPVSCQSGCAITYDDCCELPAHLLSPCCRQENCHLTLLRRRGAGNNPCPRGQTCTDGIGTFTCA